MSSIRLTIEEEWSDAMQLGGANWFSPRGLTTTRRFGGHSQTPSFETVPRRLDRDHCHRGGRYRRRRLGTMVVAAQPSPTTGVGDRWNVGRLRTIPGVRPEPLGSSRNRNPGGAKRTV